MSSSTKRTFSASRRISRVGHDRYRAFTATHTNGISKRGAVELAAITDRYEADGRRSCDAAAISWIVSAVNAVDLAYITEMATVALRRKFSGK